LWSSVEVHDGTFSRGVHSAMGTDISAFTRRVTSALVPPARCAVTTNWVEVYGPVKRGSVVDRSREKRIHGTAPETVTG
jgi:hypothetical protein